MPKSHLDIVPSSLSVSLTGLFLLGVTLTQGSEASANLLEVQTNRGENSLISLEFKPPGDPLPVSTVAGGSRGNIKFSPPGDALPESTVSGGTRGTVTFESPEQESPQSSAPGGSRGSTVFQAPEQESPQSSASGGSRGSTLFQAPGESIPDHTVAAGSRGSALFQAPGESTPDRTVAAGSRGSALFQAPGESTPDHTVAAGSRTDELPDALALLPDNNYGHTIAARPTFFVYVPSTESKEVFFSIQDENRRHHYQTTLKISGQGGIVKITLPQEAPELEMGKTYQWFFALIEPGNILRPDNYGVNGWVKRVSTPVQESASSSMTIIEQATLYAKSGIWYDTLEILSDARLAQPNDVTLAEEWKDLLEQVKLEEIATQPLTEQL